jgi:hypothetical protein
MPCEKYREALIDAAAGEAPSAKLKAHLDSCPACRATFAAEQQLFAALDSGVGAAVNRQAPAVLLPRVRSRLDDQGISGFSWIKVGAAFATAALVLMSAIFVRRLHSEKREPLAAVNAVGPRTKNPVSTSPLVQPKKHAIEPVTAKVNHPRAAAAPKRAEETAVLVPAGQKEAVDKLLVALSTGTVNSATLVAEKNAQSSANGELLPLVVPEMQIPPLAAVSEESGPTR